MSSYAMSTKTDSSYSLKSFKGKNMEKIVSIKELENIKFLFGELVRKKRQKKGISQEELAFRSGLHRTYVGSVERGERNVSLENIFILAIALDCNPKDLIPTPPSGEKKKIIRTIVTIPK